MKYQNKQALDLNGVPLTENGKPCDIATLMWMAVIADLREDEKLTISQKRDIYRLKQKLAMVNGEIELSSDERTLILERGAKTLKLDAFGQVDDFLEHPIS